MQLTSHSQNQSAGVSQLLNVQYTAWIIRERNFFNPSILERKHLKLLHTIIPSRLLSDLIIHCMGIFPNLM